MTPKESTPLSGYAIGKVYSSTAQLKPASTDAKRKEEGVNFGWDWRWTEQPAVFEVRLTITMEATAERPYSAGVDAIGQFRQVVDAPTVKLEGFVCLQAVAILMPYLRQYLTNLTVNTLQGPYFLPSINIADLMKDFDPSKATGANQRPVARRKTKTEAKEKAIKK